ncbi:sesquipedalian-1 [Engraulis encrasicolus]|uniref:sesquipedalian-1 n=1 Tax=Engraulis encrasicolus TaxID=184585 RepID=UPI002FD4114B
MKLNERSVAHYATCDTPPDKTGFLLKKGERNTAYHRRWCVLKGNMLFYFEERESKEPIGVIVLEGCTVELCESAESEFAFAIKFECARARIYKMAAESQAGMESWVKALSRASFDYMRLVVRELEKQLEDLQDVGARRARSFRKPNGTQPQLGVLSLSSCPKSAVSAGGALTVSSSGSSQGPTVAPGSVPGQPEDAHSQTGHGGKENGVAWSKPCGMTNGVSDTTGVVWDADGSGGRGDGSFRPPPVPPRRRGGSGSFGGAPGTLESPFSPETSCFSKLHDWYGKEVAELRIEWLQSQ